VEACFKLAELVKVQDTTVLRLARKGWLADILEQRERGSVGERLTHEQRSLVSNYEVVKGRSPKTARRLRALLDELATDARTRPVASRRLMPTKRRVQR